MKISLAIALLAAASAHAQARYDHKGAVGLLIGISGERKDSATINGGGDLGWRLGAELGVTVAVGSDGNELKGALRGLFGGIEVGCSNAQRCAPVDLSLMVGYRGYFDMGQWKTFLDLDLVQHVVPHFNTSNNRTQIYTIGPRVALGAQLDFLPVAGALLMLEGQIGFGDGLRYGAGLVLCFQLRSYWLE